MLFARPPLVRSLLLGSLAAVATVTTAGAASATTPPAVDVADVASGLQQYLDDLGPLTYEGDDITVGECPLIDESGATAGVAELDGATALVAEEEAQVELIEEVDVDDTFEPAAVSCEFAAEADDAGLSSLGVIALDLSDETAAAAVEPMTELPAVEGLEPLTIEGEIVGDCQEDECLIAWSADEVAILLFFEFADDTGPELASVAAAAASIVTTTAGNLAALA